ncbi:hypothetical protein HNQ54_000565 [Anaerocolumna cellulosilytica]|nr:hypothetical protein [Anaerocolumna cellulosilytica]
MGDKNPKKAPKKKKTVEKSNAQVTSSADTSKKTK